MDFSFPPEAEAFRTEVRAFLAEHLTEEMIEATLAALPAKERSKLRPAVKIAAFTSEMDSGQMTLIPGMCISTESSRGTPFLDQGRAHNEGGTP